MAYVAEGGADGLTILARGVFLHPCETGWEAGVTWHGRNHWVKTVPDPAQLEAIVLNVLRGTDAPPGKMDATRVSPVRGAG